MESGKINSSVCTIDGYINAKKPIFIRHSQNYWTSPRTICFYFWEKNFFHALVQT